MLGRHTLTDFSLVALGILVCVSAIAAFAETTGGADFIAVVLGAGFGLFFVAVMTSITLASYPRDLSPPMEGLKKPRLLNPARAFMAVAAVMMLLSVGRCNLVLIDDPAEFVRNLQNAPGVSNVSPGVLQGQFKLLLFTLGPAVLISIVLVLRALNRHLLPKSWRIDPSNKSD